MTVPGSGRIDYERLIALVHERPPLYDYSNPAHCNRDVTSAMWADIAAELNMTDVACKTKWAILRSNFVREMRRIRPAEDGTMWPPQWPLFKPLMFLIPFLKIRGSSGSNIKEHVTAKLDFEEFQNQISGSKEQTVQINKKSRLEAVPAEEDTDDDKLFMLSLVPKIKLLPVVDNLKFRIEVEQLLLKRLCQLSKEPNPAESAQIMLCETNEQQNDIEKQCVKIEHDDHGYEFSNIQL